MTPEQKAKKAAYMKVYNATDERRARLAACCAAYRKSDKGQANQAAYNGSDERKATLAAFGTSNEGRKSQYRSRYRDCNPTQEQWEHYRDSTHCECCGVVFGRLRSGTGKCQDHNHKTNELRGVICGTCNTMEGLCKTSERAYAVACYMAAHTPLNDLIKQATGVTS